MNRFPVRSALACIFAVSSLTGSARAASPPTSPASPVGEEASTHFKRGLQLFDEGDYTLALVEFERAYQLAPNYRALYNIALVDMQLGRYADAARTLEQYVRDGGSAIAPSRQAEVTKTLAELKLRTATLEVITNVQGAEVTLDGKPLDPAALKGTMVIDAGEHTLRATSPGYLAANKTLTLAGTDHVTAKLELVIIAVARAAPMDQGDRVSPFWPGFVATGALAAGAIASGAVMLDARSHWQSLQNTYQSDPGARTTWANRQNTAALVADVFTGAAVAAGGVSVYLSLRPVRPSKSPSLAIWPGGVSLSKSF